MPVPGLSLLGLKRIRGFASILRYINPTIIITIIIIAKNGGHFEFSNFCAEIAKHKNANILKTVLYRAISTKFVIFRVSLQSSYPKELSLGEVSDP